MDEVDGEDEKQGDAIDVIGGGLTERRKGMKKIV